MQSLILCLRRLSPSYVITTILLTNGLLASTAQRVAADDSRPNILFMMSDDHAAHAIGAYGSKLNQTPNIDRIAREGLLLENCFVTNSVCTPSRATILTGKYSHKNGVPTFNTFDGSQWTVAKELRHAGYHTGMIGKWHLGETPTGFDAWEILPGQGKYENPTFISAQGSRQLEGYATDIITDLSVQFLDRRPKDKPFFLMYHHKAPHGPWVPSKKQEALFADKIYPIPETFFDDYASRSDATGMAEMRVADMTERILKVSPPVGLSTKEQAEWKYQRYMRDYLACVASVDENVGRMLDYLDENDLSKNTIVIYTSDQGFFLGEHGWYDKRFMYEESLRMPFVIRWPGVVSPASRSDLFALNVDFAPTFLDAVGLSVPSDLQGQSLVPILQGKRPDDWRKTMYYRFYHTGHNRVQPHWGVRTEHHKLIYFNRLDQWELYDLTNDPQEISNVYVDPAYTTVRSELHAKLSRLQQSLDDQGQYSDIQQDSP